ncbi:MAG: Fic family protein, partial [bacterium]|nr:Fic family protein [bacterium]
AWQSTLDDRGSDIRRFFDAQLKAHELLLDAVSEKAPVSEAWVRRLHEELCRAQDTYRVRTPQGDQHHPFPKGEYKKQPNHVLQQNGSFFAFAPVAQTPSELYRIVEELRSEPFLSADPILQAAYSHYAFVRIHPFADGNGRVARALGSLYLLKAYSIPLVIFADQKEEYLAALRDADRGEFQSLVDFLGERTRETLEICLEQLKASPGRPVAEIVSSLNEIYQNHGHPHEDLNQGAYRLLAQAEKELKRRLDELQLPSDIDATVTLNPVSWQELEDMPRPVLYGGNSLMLRLSSMRPAKHSVSGALQVFVPTRERTSPAEILLKIPGDPPWSDLEPFTARVNEVVPELKNVVDVRLGIWISRFRDLMLVRLERASRESLEKSGY